MIYRELEYAASPVRRQEITETDRSALYAGLADATFGTFEDRMNFLGADYSAKQPEIQQPMRDEVVASNVIEIKKFSRPGKKLAAIGIAVSAMLGTFSDKIAADGDNASAPPVPAGQRREVTIPGKNGRTAVINTTVTQVQGEKGGFFSWLQDGEQPGITSDLNADHRFQTVAGLSLVKLSEASADTGLYTQTGAHLIADVQGFFAPNAFNDTINVRIKDTRNGRDVLPAGTFTELIGEPGQTGVMVVVATDTGGPGFVQVMENADLSQVGKCSSLNVDAIGQTRSSLVFVTFNAQGKAYLFNQNPLNFVVDRLGYMNSASYKSSQCVRLLDTRGGPMPGYGSWTIVKGGTPGSTSILTVAGVETRGSGYFQVGPLGTQEGATSSGNAEAAGQIVPFLVFAKFNEKGETAIYNHTPGAHFVVNLIGEMAEGAFEDTPDERVLDTRNDAPAPINPALIQPPNTRKCRAGERPNPAYTKVYIDSNGALNTVEWCDI